MKIDKHLNHALVEESRPPMYTAMKYWGKKPHNIWREFIECYSPENGIVLDPFAGSGIAAFEGVVANRKMITLDINPMSSFFIEVTTMPFNETLFTQAAHNIITTVEKDETIRKIHAKSHKGEPFSLQPDEIDAQRLIDKENIDIPYWYPQDQFPKFRKIKRDMVCFLLSNGGVATSFYQRSANHVFLFTFQFTKLIVPYRITKGRFLPFGEVLFSAPSATTFIWLA